MVAFGRMNARSGGLCIKPMVMNCIHVGTKLPTEPRPTHERRPRMLGLAKIPDCGTGARQKIIEATKLKVRTSHV